MKFNPPGPGGIIHRCGESGYTACRIWIPDLPKEDRYWHPQDATAGSGPTTCTYCLAGKPAPLCSTDPNALTMWTVYDHPRDFPDEAVAREWKVAGGRETSGALVARGPTLKACRIALDGYLARIGRGGLTMLCRIPASPGDDSVIVETWI